MHEVIITDDTDTQRLDNLMRENHAQGGLNFLIADVPPWETVDRHETVLGGAELVKDVLAIVKRRLAEPVSQRGDRKSIWLFAHHINWEDSDIRELRNGLIRIVRGGLPGGVRLIVTTDRRGLGTIPMVITVNALGAYREPQQDRTNA